MEGLKYIKFSFDSLNPQFVFDRERKSGDKKINNYNQDDIINDIFLENNQFPPFFSEIHENFLSALSLESYQGLKVSYNLLSNNFFNIETKLYCNKHLGYHNLYIYANMVVLDKIKDQIHIGIKKDMNNLNFSLNYFFDFNKINFSMDYSHKEEKKELETTLEFTRKTKNYSNELKISSSYISYSISKFITSSSLFSIEFLKQINSKDFHISATTMGELNNRFKYSFTFLSQIPLFLIDSKYEIDRKKSFILNYKYMLDSNSHDLILIYSFLNQKNSLIFGINNKACVHYLFSKKLSESAKIELNLELNPFSLVSDANRQYFVKKVGFALVLEQSINEIELEHFL